MKIIIKIFFAFSFFLLCNNSMAYCVYNATEGNDTLRRIPSTGIYNAPTLITFHTPNYFGKQVQQLDYGCDLTTRRGPTDSSTVNIMFISEYIGDYPRAELICSKQVYNKGGYVIVQGNKANGFRCDVYRDKV